jgi:Hypothetical protein (DUF2513)
MKRDMELIRELLMAIEDQQKPVMQVSDLKLRDEWDVTVICHNLQLLVDADFIMATPVKTMAGVRNFTIQRMTWNGHDFLDNARSESIWSTAKETITKKGLSLETVGFGVLTQVLASVAKQILALN